MESLLELLKPIVGEQADEITRSLILRIRDGEGGVRGFFERIRSAGFDSNLDSWINGRITEVSPALVANLFGAGTMDTLATRNSLTIEKVTQATALSLPYLAQFLSPEATKDAEPVSETALNTKQKPSIVWGLIAAALTAMAIWASLGMGQPQARNPNEVAPVLMSEPAPEQREDASFSIVHQGTGVSYRGNVPKAHLAHLQSIIDSELGDKASGALIGVDAKDPQWAAHFGEIVKLMNSPKRILEIYSVSGNSIEVEGGADDLDHLRQELQEMKERTGMSIGWSHVGNFEHH